MSTSEQKYWNKEFTDEFLNAQAESGEKLLDQRIDPNPDLLMAKQIEKCNFWFFGNNEDWYENNQDEQW